MPPILPLRRCAGCPKKISQLKAYCPDCAVLVRRAELHHPLPEVAPHPVGPTCFEDWQRATPELEQQLIDADGKYDAQMRERCHQADILRDQALLMMVAAYGIGHPLVVKLRKLPPIQHSRQDRGAAQVRGWREERARRAAVKHADEKDLERARKAERARAFLRKHGREVEGVDDDAALDLAYECAADLRIEEQRPPEGSFINFDGRRGCGEDCRGWDGRSNTCDCGGHRLCWHTEGDFEDGYVYAGPC